MYSEYTINSKNPLARLAHRSRLSHAHSHIAEYDVQSILDIGCGDGTFLHQMRSKKPYLLAVGYEPYMDSVYDDENIKIYKKWEKITHKYQSKQFDLITCFEVMEHLSKKQQTICIEKIKEMAGLNTKILISVPIEKGMVSLVKNIRRACISYRGNENIYNIRNITASIFGMKTKEIINIRNSDDYLPHMGFYFDELLVLLNQYFNVESIRYSPFGRLPSYFNSQVFFALKLKNIDTNS